MLTPMVRFTASIPEIHRRAASLFSFASALSSPFQRLFFLHRQRPFAIAMMRLVIQDDDVLHSHQRSRHAAQHLPVAFGFDLRWPAQPAAPC